MRNDPREVMRKIIGKYRRGAELAAQEGILPYKSEDGHWLGSPHSGNGWWTGGFWPGMMWQLYCASGDEAFHEEALRAEELLVEEMRLFRNLHHDVGFMYLLSCGANSKLTGAEQAEQDTLHAANLPMGRFNPAGFIRAWNGAEKVGYAIIDCMMNLTILMRAQRITGDPRFGAVARIHADTTIREFIREDGSSAHIIEFDPQTGARVQEHPGQGWALGSSWSRGQAWGLYGFTLMYMNTGEQRYLDTAEGLARYFIAHIRPDGLTDCDFCQPPEEERIDNIAGMAASCGLIELAKITGNASYHAAAETLLDGAIDHCSDYSDRICGVLTHCTAKYHGDLPGRHTNIVYGDYFLTEALAKLTGSDPMLWI